MKHGTYSVYVVQFARSSKDPSTFHWEICIRLGGPEVNPRGNIYHVVGSQTKFTYQRLEDVKYTSPVQCRGYVKVGTIPQEYLDTVEELFAKVRVVSNDPKWTCRTWVHRALRTLYICGFDIAWDPRIETLYQQMSEALEAWECGII